MEQLMNDLLRQIADKMGNLVQVVDEDYGQLDALKNGEETYAVTFPCVLVGVPETNWESLNADTQRGLLTISVRLAVNCGVQIPEGSSAAEQAAQRNGWVEELNDAVQGWQFDGCQSAARRTRSVQTAMPGNVKVYEQQYDITVMRKTQNSAS